MDTTGESTIDAIIAEALAQRMAGGTLNVESLVAAHPDRADEIRARFADLDKLAAIWRDMSVGGNRPGSVAGSLQVGTKLGEFEIIRELGRGGMGIVYLARQPTLGRMVALKIIPQAAGLSEVTRSRFLREAAALASLSHPNIVPVFAAGEEGGILFIAMEYVEGVSLAEILDAVRACPADGKASDVWRATVAGTSAKAERISGRGVGPARTLDREYIRSCCKAAIAVARALHAAHAKGIIHRDVKPGNIIIDRDGRARLLDFGLAAINTQPHVTVSGEFFGTPNYVSPEQARGQRDRIDCRTDVYSLGATLYECMTLAPPFDASSTPEVLTRLVRDEPTPARTVNRSIGRDLNTIVMKAIAKAPHDRYATVGAFADDVGRHLDDRPILARPISAPARLVRKAIKRPIYSTLILLALALLCATCANYRNLLKYHEALRQSQADQELAERQARGFQYYRLGHARMYGPLIVDGVRIPKDERKAIEDFRLAAETGNTDAMYELATAYAAGAGVQKDMKVSVEWAKRGALAGHARSMTIYGMDLLINKGNMHEGLGWLERAANAGDVGAMNSLGRAYLGGNDVSPDLPKALNWLSVAASSTHTGLRHDVADSMFWLGNYYEAYAEPPDLATAILWYTRASEQGNVKATECLAQAHVDGRGVKKDFVIARAWLEKALQQGSTIAAYALGNMLMAGEGGLRDQARARDLFEIAANAGHGGAMFCLGTLYRDGAGVQQDYAIAGMWFEHASTQGNADAMEALGVMRAQGLGAQQDMEMAREWLEKAAAAGSTHAMQNLGRMYLNGVGTAKSLEKSLDWFTRAAKVGDVGAMEMLGFFYLGNMGFAKDYPAAEEWLTRAVGLGSRDAAEMLADMAYFGWGAPSDLPLARQRYEKAGELGSASAMAKLAVMCEDGRGGPADQQRALELLAKAVYLGDGNAMAWYGQCFEAALGVPRDAQKAFALYKQSAEKGSILGMRWLAACYENGTGTTRDLDQARHWYGLAAARDDSASARRLADMATSRPTFVAP